MAQGKIKYQSLNFLLIASASGHPMWAVSMMNKHELNWFIRVEL